MSEHAATLSKDGRLLIPAAIREELGLRVGEALSVSVVDGEVRIVSRLAAVRRMQHQLAHLRDPKKSAVDELLRERREAAVRGKWQVRLLLLRHKLAQHRQFRIGDLRLAERRHRKHALTHELRYHLWCEVGAFEQHGRKFVAVLHAQ
jgi:AbrB family looped-hinge helix DNA binding protein